MTRSNNIADARDERKLIVTIRPARAGLQIDPAGSDHRR